MPSTVLVGAQWGDEGKGKVVDVLTREADIVVRFQGGSNAGHTVIFGEERHVLHLIPSGILHADKICVIGNGVVVDPLALIEEIRALEQRGFVVEGRLFVSDRAHMVLSTHRAVDVAHEAARTEADRIGTTGRGIGPAYGDKAARTGLRMGDLVEPDFAERLVARVEAANLILDRLGAATIDAEEARRQYTEAARILKPYVADTVSLLHEAESNGKHLLLEGAQGTMLDIDFGSYPFVTSSNPTAGGACTGTGLPPTMIRNVVGIVKAYTTRVGEGPFPTELNDAIGEHIRERGGEFGATTGRPRRCGWFDGVVAKHAAVVNGVTEWAVTKLDVLDELDTLSICVAYNCEGRRLSVLPASLRALKLCEPVYETMPGWRQNTRGVTRYEDLPLNARRYVERLCALLGAPIKILSLGPARESTLRISPGISVPPA